jgi:opacity protein-like surface antigen
VPRHPVLVVAVSSALFLTASFARAEDVPVPPMPGSTTSSEASTVTPGGLSGVDVMTATVFQQGQSSFSGLGLRFRIGDSRLLDSVELLPTIEYWRNSTTLDAGAPVGRIHAVRRDATIGFDVRYVIPRENFNAYVGTGIGVHFLSNEARVGTTQSDDSLTKGGLTLLAGASFANTSRFGNFLEVKAHFVGGYRQIKLNMGLSWNR